MALGGLTSLMFGAGLLGIYCIAVKRLPGKRAWQMVKRLRWFFLSIAIVYLWFTPGEFVFPVWEHWSPTFEGVWQALQRISVLVLLVLSVNSLLVSLSREELMAALHQLAVPFSGLGLSPERFALRLALTLEIVTAQRQKTSTSSEEKNTGRTSVREKIDALAMALEKKFIQALDVEMNEKEIEVPRLATPAFWQWSVPVLLMLVFWVVH